MCPSRECQAPRKSGAVVQQALESFAEQQMTPVLLRFCQERQQHVAVLLGYVVGSEQLKRIRDVDHLRDRRRLFERIVAERERNPRHLPVKRLIGLWSAAGDDLRLALRRRVLDTHVETAPADGVAQSALLITGEHDEGNALCADGAKLGNRKRPCGKYFQQHCFEAFVYLVQLVNEQHAWPVAFECAHQRTGPKEVPPFEVRLNTLPALVLAL